jgi:hypothetical protein
MNQQQSDALTRRFKDIASGLAERPTDWENPFAGQSRAWGKFENKEEKGRLEDVKQFYEEELWAALYVQDLQPRVRNAIQGRIRAIERGRE